MKFSLFFFVALALGSANPISSSTDKSTREYRIKTAIDRNVRWLLDGISSETLEGPDLPRAVVALFLAEPGLLTNVAFSGLINIKVILSLLPTSRLRSMGTEELASYVLALTVLHKDPTNFLDEDLTSELWQRGIQSQQTGGRFPSNAFLALCVAEAIHHLSSIGLTPLRSINLTDEEALTMMSIDCFESYAPPELQSKILKSGYQYYPSNLTVEKLQELMNPDDGNSPSLSAVAAAMQTLMYKDRLQVSALPLALDFLLNNQDEDGSWGQSALNSFYILPVLLNKSFLNISRGEEFLYSSISFGLADNNPILNRDYSNSLYDLFTAEDPEDDKYKAIYQNGTDGKPYLISFSGQRNRPRAGYFWNTYERDMNGTLTRLTQSHADIKVRRNYRYELRFCKRSQPCY